MEVCREIIVLTAEQRWTEKGEKMPRLKLIEMDSLNKMIYFRKDDKLIAFDADVAIELISDSLDGKYAPVRHGKWTHNKWSNMRHDYSCSLCGCRISGVDPFSLSATAYYYCPECGAKMDEVEDG